MQHHLPKNFSCHVKPSSSFMSLQKCYHSGQEYFLEPEYRLDANPTAELFFPAYRIMRPFYIDSQ